MTSRLDRWATPRVLLALLAAEVVLLASINLTDLPLSVPEMRRLTGHTYLDMCAFCSAERIGAELDAFGAAGRIQQLRFSGTVDVAVPLLSAAFGVVALRVLARARWLLVVPLLAGGLDFVENGAIAALVIGYPERWQWLSQWAGVISGAKAVAYGATAATVLVAAAARAIGRVNPSSGRRASGGRWRRSRSRRS